MGINFHSGLVSGIQKNPPVMRWNKTFLICEQYNHKYEILHLRGRSTLKVSLTFAEYFCISLGIKFQMFIIQY